MKSSLQFLQYPLSDRAVHIDFLRLRCGTEMTFQKGIADVRKKTSESLHTFVAFSEWDAVIVVPSSELYPRTLTEIYANAQVASSVSGTSGYFAYLWAHPVNEYWPDHFTHFERSGPSILTSLRFAEWFRRDVGLGAELLFCNHLHTQLQSERYRGLHAVVAHSLGWNDVILFTHCDDGEQRLTELLASVRLTTLADCVGPQHVTEFSVGGNSQIFAASYTHLLGGFDNYMDRNLSLGDLATQIESARILVRVAPPHEQEVREFMDKQRTEAKVTVIPSEMGHYSLSMDISEFTKAEGGQRAIAFVADTRNFIGGWREGFAGQKNEPDSYAETTTIFRFVEPNQQHVPPPEIPITEEVRREIEIVERVMGELPHLLEQLGASAMTGHRFVSVLLTLLDHLSDPVRSSVVRHLSRFASTIPDLLRELDPDGIDDLCHVLEYAVGQAIDGIAQFQHDANALGLSGRGGYSRLIVTVEWYIYSTFARLGVTAPLPLITFGLRSGNAGSTRRYQIDIPFNVLFLPSRWHNLLHEVGHLAWQHIFGWMLESLAIYRGLEKEIRMEVQRYRWKDGQEVSGAEADQLAKEWVHVEFLRAREFMRELFPNYLIFALPCGADLEVLDGLMVRHMTSLGHPSSVTRELLLIVVLRCLIEIMDSALRGGAADPKNTMSDAQCAATWWGIWDELKADNCHERIRKAVHAVGAAIKKVGADALATGLSSGHHNDLPGMKIQVLESASFAKASAEALHSTIQVLALRGRHFRDQTIGTLRPELFGHLLARITRMQSEQSDYDSWIGTLFASWMHEGLVFPNHRDGVIWSRLLLASRAELLAGGRTSLMRSQLSVLLSMWHDAITEGQQDKERTKLQRLITVGIVQPKQA